MSDIVDSRTQHMSDIHFLRFLVFFLRYFSKVVVFFLFFFLLACRVSVCQSISTFFVRMRSAGISKYKKRDCSREVGGCSL